ncbi:hypothetical protein LG315_07510 [Microbacterium marinum]|uniref:hypothetical protein n=1 Tax=Microbacterium marinum TaxID=421115 RepID=UPI00384E0ACD
MAPAWESVSTMAFENSSALGSDLLATTVFRSVAVTALEAFALDRAFRSARWGFTERSLTRTHVEVYGVRPQDLLGR